MKVVGGVVGVVGLVLVLVFMVMMMLMHGVVEFCMAQTVEGLAVEGTDMHIDEHRNLHINSNNSVVINGVDVRELQDAIFQQQGVLETLAAENVEQAAQIAVLTSEIEELGSQAERIPCHTFNPIQHYPSEYTYVPTLSQRVYVDPYFSNPLSPDPSDPYLYLWNTATLGPNGVIYAAPADAGSILTIDTSTGAIDNATLTVSSTQPQKFFGVVTGGDNRLYFVPHNADYVAILDPINGNFLNEVSMTGLGVGGRKWAGGALAPMTMKIYCTPYDSPSVLIINPSGQTTDVTTISNLPNEVRKWTGAILSNNGFIYAMPVYATSVLMIDPQMETADYQTLTLDGSIEQTELGYCSGGVLANNGNIYCIPFGTNKIIVVLTFEFMLSYIDIPFPDFTGWSGGVLTKTGKIIGFPSSESTMLFIDPTTDTADTTSIAVPYGEEKWQGGVVDPESNKVYAIPSTFDRVLLMEFDDCI